MPRKEIITKGMVLDAAFGLVREKGLSGLTARSIGSRLRCSTIPIYSHFRSMGELEAEVLEAASSLLLEYTKKGYTPHPFLNMGIGMVTFSRDERELFKLVLSGDEMARSSVKDIRKAFREGLLAVEDFRRFPAEHLDSLLDMMMAQTIGLATMASSGILEGPTEERISAVLDEAGDAMINHTIRKALGMETRAGAVLDEQRTLQGNEVKRKAR